ncbi:hypothetical protein N9917_00140 [Deltaproteobacteria bacterium]|nr:hypothetical protein [Deltaproteobacteria bacterium]
MDRSTPDLIAQDIIASFKHGFADNPELWTDEKKAERLAQFIEKAVRRERAACADLALSRTYEGRDDGDTARRIAAAIKQRGYRESHGSYMVAHLPQDKIEGLATLRAVFDDDVDYGANWLFLSTSGVHGSYTTLDEISRDAQRLDNGNCWDVDHEVDCECGAEWDDDNHPYVHPDGSFRITALMVKPRVVQAAYGTVWATVADIPWLREVVRKTLEGVKQSQSENTLMVVDSTPHGPDGQPFFDAFQEASRAISEAGMAGERRSAVMDDPDACKHLSVMPEFDEEDAKGMSALEIKKKYPRFMGSCPECGGNVILYASFMHYINGDW